MSNDNFFSPTRVWLFGKKFAGLKYDATEMKSEFSKYEVPTSPDKNLPIPPRRIERALRRGLDPQGNPSPADEQKIFARIYSFSYEGHYYRLPRPLLFLVREKDGVDVGDRLECNSDDAKNCSADIKLLVEIMRQVVSKLPPMKFTSDLSGVEARDWDFSNDIKVWRVDRKDLAVCLDVEIGNYQEVLLDSMIAQDRRDEERASRSRGDITGRGAGSFRGDMIGPHQNKFR